MFTNGVHNLNYHDEDVSETWPKIAGARFIAGTDQNVRIGGSQRADLVKRLCPFVGAGKLIRPEIEIDASEAEMIAFSGIRLEKMDDGNYRAADRFYS